MVTKDDSKKEPLVSFVVNCYNGEKYLKRCLNSILKQQYSNWELIFWDNASTDKSADIFKSYNDNRFKYFKSKKNVSLGQARAWAVDQCQGEYIAFLDVDDEWLPEKTSLQIERMLEDDSVLSYGGIIEMYENRKKVKLILPKHPSLNNFKHNLMQFEIQMPTIMIKHSTLIQKGLNFDPQVFASEEYCLSMQLMVGEKVSVIKRPLAKYLVRTNSLTNKYISRWFFERRYTLNKIVETHPQVYIKYKKEFKEAYFRSDYYEAEYLFFSNNRKVALKKIKPAIFYNWKYFVVFILMNLPSPFWNFFRKVKYNRNL